MATAVKQQDPVTIPVATAVFAWREAAGRRQTLRAQLKETSEELARVRTEIDRLATAALEVEARVLLGDASQRELDQITTAAGPASAKAQELESWAGRLKTELAAIEGDLPKLKAAAERGEREAAKAGRAMHEQIVARIAKAAREIAAANVEEERVAMALYDIFGERTTRYIRRLRFKAIGTLGDFNSGVEMWLQEARELGGYDV